jgi:phage head maturation protease
MKNINLICEAKLSLGQSADESQNPLGAIEARVTTWGPREGADGRKFNYQPDGFMEWGSAFKEAGKPMPMFLNHNDMGMPVGEWTECNFDKEGMTAKGRLFMETSGGSDLYNVLKESPNLFGGVSVGAYADEARWVDEKGDPFGDDDDPDFDPFDDPDFDFENAYFQITKGGLREVSVVMYPNNPEANIQKLEYFSADGLPNPRNIEKALRDAGLTRKDATTASSILKKLIESRDATHEANENPTKQGDPAAVVNEAEILALLQEREILAALSNHLGK